MNNASDQSKRKADYVIVGAGLAGSELAWQLLHAGKKVLLIEMRPNKSSEAHETPGFAELVCSNSFRSANPANAVGLLKEEMAALGSLMIQAALKAKVPAGDALAVDRTVFSAQVTEVLRAHPLLETVCAEVLGFESCEGGVQVQTTAGTYAASRAICATGPLTSTGLYQFLKKLVGRESLYFYDSIAPIVDAASIDHSIVYALSRYGKGEATDYLNCPMSKDEYDRFIDALLAAEKVPIHDIDRPIFFEGCLPIEVMAERGHDTLRFGPMKPVGLEDPSTGKRPHAVVQLRIENQMRTCYNLVGFQTRLKQHAQREVFSLVPGLRDVAFLRYGAMHRNTYLESPLVLNDFLESPALPRLHFAGQITGVEGYVESAAIGLLLGKIILQLDRNQEVVMPPATTALGALYRHLRDQHQHGYCPNNVHFGLFVPPDVSVHKKARKEYMLARARAQFNEYRARLGG